MHVDDALLPAAPHLTGPFCRDLLEPVVAAAGGQLLEVRPNQVLYRPGRELTVAYAATVRWSGRDTRNETLLAGTTRAGAIPGTVPMEAGGLQVCVWRYPFDPELPALRAAVTATELAQFLDVDASVLSLTVCSFRARRRAVVHAVWPTGEAYVKVVPPAEAGRLIDRHRLLAAAGLPVPAVLQADVERGLIVLAPLAGEELRTRLVRGDHRVPSGNDLFDFVQRFGEATLTSDTRPLSLIAAAPRHAAMLRRVLPSAQCTLDELLRRIGEDERPGPTATVHGDLHEAQLRIDDDGQICGVLDVDGAGPGDPLDDLARSIGHLIALSILNPDATHVRRHADQVHAEVGERVGDRPELDRRIAASLIGLATGPYRTQSERWGDEVTEVLSAAEAFVAVAST